MSKLTNIFAALCLGVLLIAISGCDDREPSVERIVLKSGRQVKEANVGWVAVPNTEPKVAEDKTAGVSYAVLTGQNVVPVSMNNWVAMPAALFNKMTSIKTDEPKAGTAEKWLLKPEGRSVPKDKNGWLAVPASSPEIESRGNGLELAKVYSGNIVPKEMNGWVAVNAETMAKISEKYMMTGKGSKVSKE